MATHHDRLTDAQQELIGEARLFFVATVASDLSVGPNGQGPVNVSPKGNTPLCVIDSHRVAYLDYHGSGNETARHAVADGPITIMVMSLDASDAGIVRLYGRATVTPLDESPLAERLLEQCGDSKGLRQVIEVEIEHTQTSCGYGVPVYEYVADRAPSQRGRRFK